MEPKRELSSVDLRALVGELSGYAGATVDKAYRYDEDLLRLKLRDHDRGRVELLLETGEVKRLHVADPRHVPDAPERPPNFAMMLRNRLGGAEFVSIEQHEFDRIVALEFSRSDGRTRLVAELFGEGNVAVLDATGTVVDCLRTVRLKSRTVVPGSTYGFPASRVDPLELDYEAFAARMADSDTDLVRTLATQLNLGGHWAEELCTRAGVEKMLPIDDAGDDDYEALHEALRALADDLAVGRLDPRVYYEGDRRVDATPFPLEAYAGLKSEAFEAFNAALDDYFAHLDRNGGRDGPDVEELVEEHQRIVTRQEEAIERFKQEAERERENAELVYAHYGLVDELLSVVREAREAGHPWEEIAARLDEAAERDVSGAGAVVGVNPAAGTVTIELDGREIELDPSVGVERNADRLYTDAKEIEEKREGALEAVADTREKLAELERRLVASELEADEAGEDSEPVDWLSRPSVPVRKPEHWYERFRWFHTSDGFLVIGGRNADQNEELVKKYLDRGDRFLHAQAAGAPATVLKATEPGESPRDVDLPERSLREAAQFAVSYSSVWRDGHFAGDAYAVGPDQVTKTPESGEYLQKGSFAIRGERTYFRDVAVGCAVGIACEPETRVVGGPPTPIGAQAATAVEVEPGRYARQDAAKRIYRTFRERFADTAFVRKVAGPEEIARFLPPGGSRIVD